MHARRVPPPSSSGKFYGPFESLDEAIDVANEEMLASFLSEDFKEGVAHFLETCSSFPGR